MDTSNKRMQFIFNLNFTKVLYIYQIVDSSNTTRIFGYKIPHIIITCIALPMVIVSLLSPIGLYYSLNNTIVFTIQLGFIINFLFSCYKMMNVLYYSNDIWKCLDVMRFNFLLYQNYNRNIIYTKWQNRFSRVIFTYITIYSVVFIIWALSPVIFNPMSFLSGSNTGDRSNIFNLYLIASHETYQNNFFIFYLIESTLSFGYLYYSLIFDLLITMICYGLSCQLEVVSDGIQSLGHIQSSTNILETSDVMLLEKVYDDIYYNDLIFLIKHHQNLIERMTEFYNIFRTIMLLQIFVNSSQHILIWFILAVKFSEGGEENIIMSIKQLIALSLFSFQLFMTCYYFETINKKKDSIIFALYSSNWIAMSIRSKGLILYTMKMNNVNQLKLKYTETKIVNLEMYTFTLRVCYSIFSMLVKYKKSE